MTESYTIQCQSCGTVYNDLEEVCPYCGQPQSDLVAETPYAEEEYTQEHIYEDGLAIEEQETVFLDEHVGSYRVVQPQTEDEGYEEAYLLENEATPAAEPFEDDDIFAGAGQREYVEQQVDEYADGYGYYDDDYYASHPEAVLPEEYDELDETGPEAIDQPGSSIFTWRRMLSGCLVALVCFGLLYASIGFFAVREGLEERTLIAQTESQAHYEKGQGHLANNAIELAIAEFERALSLNPNFPAARQALREAQSIAQSQPTPTSETRSAAASDLLGKAEDQIEQRSWNAAVETLSQVRDLDPGFQAEQVSELLYTANYQMGIDLKTSARLEDALVAFESALSERPGNPQALAEQGNALLYLDGVALESSDVQRAIEILSQLYRQDSNYLDVKQRLSNAYELHGDELARAGAWCRAMNHYEEANNLQSTRALEIKAENSSNRCQESEETRVNPPPATNTPPARVPAAVTRVTETSAVQPTPTVTATNVAAQSAPFSGSIVFAQYNPFETQWEILAVPAGGGSPRVLLTDGTMPAVSPNGQLLLYHSESTASEGLHAFNLTTGKDTRVTTVRDHILPRWGGDSNQFVFVAREGGTGRWLVHQGYADAKSDAFILMDGRTPAWSANGRVVAVQGSDPIGNNPGLYLVPIGGGEQTRITSHESDRSPAFSPDGSQLAYMSTRNGNWDIFTVSTAGSAPFQVTTAPGNDGLPVWSPDGTQLAYVSDADGSWAIYVIDASGGAPVKLTEWDGRNRADWLLSQIAWMQQ